MKIWGILAASVISDLVGGMSLRAAVDNRLWFVTAASGYVGAFTGLALILREGAPLGAVYGVWASATVALTAVLGMEVFGDPFSPLMAIGIAIVTVGVMIIESGVQPASRDCRPKPGQL